MAFPMRETLLITTVLIFLSILLGVIYNVMTPYLVKLGVISQKEEAITLSKDGGVFRSENFGGTWIHSSQSQGDGELARSAVFDIQFHPSNPNALYAATSRGFYGSQNKGEEWTRIATGLEKGDEFIQSFAIDPKNPSTIYLAAYAGQQGRILKSKGDIFYEVYSTLSLKDRIYGVWVDSYDPSTVYAGTQGGLFLESKDFGESWRIKREFQAPLRGLLMVPSDTRIMYALVGSGKLFRTQNQGSTWEDISSSFPRSPDAFEIHGLAIDARDEKKLYAATSIGLFTSHNRGASFSPVNLLISSGASSVFAVAADPQNPGTIYVGLDSQVHRSADGGRSWQIKQLETTRKISVIKVKPDAVSTLFVGVGTSGGSF
jgi:photosystem II stability/assembly factor-like uncharacterized protein